jgi:hypothetical protein
LLCAVLDGKQKRLEASKKRRADFSNDSAPFLRYRPAMIIRATSSFWYFSYDSSLAAGGSRSI